MITEIKNSNGDVIWLNGEVGCRSTSPMLKTGVFI